jgi:hypothetical protein
MAETTFGWDASHFDAPPAVRDGVDLYTHKLTDGDHFFEDVEFGPAVNAARGLGVPILGPYHVLHGGRSIANQADWLLARADALTPWWRRHDCWIWQADAEPFDYLTAPTIEEINAFGDAVCARAGVPAARFLAYAPAWHYGSSLTRLRYRLWHSSYGSNPVGPYRTVYPGNTSSRWNAPVDPLLLQYGSKTTIAGQTTCDADAFRGTLDQLRTALRANSTGGNMEVDQYHLDAMLYTDNRVAALAQGLDAVAGTPSAPQGRGQEVWPVRTLKEILATQQTLVADVAAMKTALADLAAAATAGGGGTVDTALLARLADAMKAAADSLAAAG